MEYQHLGHKNRCWFREPQTILNMVVHGWCLYCICGLGCHPMKLSIIIKQLSCVLMCGYYIIQIHFENAIFASRVDHKCPMNNTHIGFKILSMCMVDLTILTKTFINVHCGFWCNVQYPHVKFSSIKYWIEHAIPTSNVCYIILLVMHCNIWLHYMPSS